MNLRLVHETRTHVDLLQGDLLLCRYVHAAGMDRRLSPRPYFHPLRTLAGTVVSDVQPPDHAWHYGLSMTVAELCGQNFWGGASYVPGRGYVQLLNNGAQRHLGWTALRQDAGGAAMDEQLVWLSATDRPWLAEERRIRVPDLRVDEGWWALEIGVRLRNLTGQELRFGSPTTLGREQAGYGGLFWRLPPEFLHGSVVAPRGFRAAMGERAPWLAYSSAAGKQQATLVFVDHPANPRHPTQWFFRNQGYPGISAAFMFDREYNLAAGAELDLRYRLAIADGVWDAARLESRAGQELLAFHD